MLFQKFFNIVLGGFALEIEKNYLVVARESAVQIKYISVVPVKRRQAVKSVIQMARFVAHFLADRTLAVAGYKTLYHGPQFRMVRKSYRMIEIQARSEEHTSELQSRE